ncbi:MAG: ABC transporter permease subunit [Flavobacteriia bacterium]|nr:ABC transporter permease subunit [Flavobacteriia bacterium]
MFALYKKEINSFLSSVIGYTFILIFLLTSGLFHWIISYETNLLEGAEADLIPFFNLAPLIFLILIPAITMRSFAEERRTGTIELLFTRPISDFQIIFAKFLACYSLVIISIIPTLIFYISMHYLGNPVGVLDDGATLTSYFGLILLAGVFVAIGIYSSSLTNSQIVAFIISMFISWFFYDGLHLLGSFNLFESFDYIIKYFGIHLHYESIKKGVIDSADIVYFFSLICLFLFASLTMIKSLKK